MLNDPDSHLRNEKHPGCLGFRLRTMRLLVDFVDPDGSLCAAAQLAAVDLDPASDCGGACGARAG